MAEFSRYDPVFVFGFLEKSYKIQSETTNSFFLSFSPKGILKIHDFCMIPTHLQKHFRSPGQLKM